MRLLSTCTSGGCGSKIGPSELAECLARLPRFDDPDLLVGFERSDDAAVYRLGPETAIVSTVDFFPPMLDDPRLFGRIAAANALSDIYAMGGRPLFALNLICFPQQADLAVLGEILQGGAETLAEAGAALAGGHSIYDHEIKYGLAATGLVHPERILRNHGCAEGDCLILTKPLGSGLIMSAARAGLAGDAEFQAAAHAMQRLNRNAAEKLARFPVHACTDVTGFGLLGHALEMAGGECTLIFDFASLPRLPGALAYAGGHLATAGGQRNRNHAAARVDVSRISLAGQELLFDPQTSGGLLISVPADCAAALLAEIAAEDPAAAIVGQVSAREDCAVVVL